MDDPGAGGGSIAAGMEADVAVATALLGFLDAVERNVAGTIDDVDTEFLHELRVAVRRTRSVLKLTGDVLPERVVAGVPEAFKWLEECLADGGSYVTLKVEQILRDAALSRSTFYRYFRDKNELLLALIEPVLGDVRLAAIRPLACASAPTREQPQADLAANFEVYRPHIPLLNALVEVSYSDPDIRARFQEGFAGVHETIAGHIAEGQAAGFVRPDIRPSETAAWITWMAERGMTQLVAVADGPGRERLAESLAAMVWHTLYDQRS